VLRWRFKVGPQQIRFTYERFSKDGATRITSNTLVCAGAGNRCKEQNMMRQTIGFNWGAGGVRRVYYVICYWRGVLVKRILVGSMSNLLDMKTEDLPNKASPIMVSPSD